VKVLSTTIIFSFIRKFLLLSLAQRKKQRNIHPLQTSPYIGKLKQKVAETANFFYVLVSRDDAMILLSAGAQRIT